MDSAAAATGHAIPALRASGLKVRYRNGAVGIEDVSLTVNPGQIVALFGPNGAGKTTTVRAISGFLRTEGTKIVNGRVEIFGKDVTAAEPHETYAAGVATVPERRKVFSSLTVDDNLVALGALPGRGQRKAAYDRVYDLFPILAERRGQLAGRLSGGQQQMLAIARSLMRQPRVLIIDEMTLGLHHSLHEPLFVAVRQIAAQGPSVVIVDESTGFALKVADYCYLLGAGQVRDSGPAEKFRNNDLLAVGYVEGD
ncbi:MAG TPA: ABC transporter ATP-binding protein [Jatrophihabitantaceae bacterium]|nr:ABC transporter ATP-binding protein [Jatrophihabitantaceae bacterium]